jgi:outer membrane protein OmpA-like peptidoglycan-associated protein
MKRHLLFALPLMATLAFPLAAQSTTDQSNAAPAQATTGSTTTATYQDRQLEPLKADTHEGFWGRVNPFARKKYVQKQLAPIRDRANELDELTASNTRMLHDVDARATAGIQRADQHAALADQHAQEAANRAQMANQTAEQAGTQLHTVSAVVENMDQYQSADQVEIRFRPGATVLSKSAKEALDKLAESMKEQKGWLVQVQGFSPGRGTASLQHSQKLADAVVRYLVINNEVPMYRIHELGLGNATVASANASGEETPHAHGSRVEISVLKNDVGGLQAGQQPAPAMSEPQMEPQGAQQ